MHHQKRAALYPIQLLIVRRKVKISALCAHGSRTGYLCVFIQMCLIYFHKREFSFIKKYICSEYMFENKLSKEVHEVMCRPRNQQNQV